VKYNLAQLQALTRQAGFPESEIAKAAAIWMYESSGDPSAVNDGSSTNTVEYSVGLAQINTRAHKNYTVEQLKNPDINLKEALRIWRGRPNYADWFNSNKKYERDYRGIASQSRTIYANGGTSIITADQVPAILNNPAGTKTEEGVIFYAGVGLLLLMLIRR
jgi:hypothetical protein